MWVEQRVVLAAPLAPALLSPRPQSVASTSREAMGPRRLCSAGVKENGRIHGKRGIGPVGGTCDVMLRVLLFLSLSRRSPCYQIVKIIH